ncbi:MAG: hypothetical protein WD294_05680 [Phycisphaeraceae bacterium]
MKKIKLPAYSPLVLLAMVMLLPVVAMGGADVTNQAFNAYLPGVNASGELDGRIGIWSSDVHQVENRNKVTLRVFGQVENRAGVRVQVTGDRCWVRLATGELVSTRDSWVMVREDGSAMLRCTYTKPDRKGEK